MPLYGPMAIGVGQDACSASVELLLAVGDAVYTDSLFPPGATISIAESYYGVE
jgi:hypothetical protein